MPQAASIVLSQPSAGVSAGLISPVSAQPSFASYFNGRIANLAPGGIAPIAIGTVPALTPGVQGQSLPYISTQGGGVSALNLLVPLTPKFTAFVTVKVPQPASGGAQTVILDNRGTNSGFGQGPLYFSLGTQASANGAPLCLHVGCPSAANYVNADFSLWDQWVTLAVTIDQSGSSQLMTIYNLTTGETFNPGSNLGITPVTTNGGPISLGTSNDGDGQNGTAQIGSVWTFPNTAMSAQDIATTYARLQKFAAYYGTSV